MTRHLRDFGLLLVLCALVPASEGLANEGLANHRRYRCNSLTVSSPDASAETTRRRRLPKTRTQLRLPKTESRRGLRTFHATAVLDLEFQVRVRRARSGEHRLALKVYTPNGHLYQTLSVPLAATESTDDETRPRRRRRRTRSRTVSATLPVAGTTIVRSSLYGTWRVEAYLDGSTQTCTAPRKFVIEP